AVMSQEERAPFGLTDKPGCGYLDNLPQEARTGLLRSFDPYDLSPAADGWTPCVQWARGPAAGSVVVTFSSRFDGFNPAENGGRAPVLRLSRTVKDTEAELASALFTGIAAQLHQAIYVVRPAGGGPQSAPQVAMAPSGASRSAPPPERRLVLPGFDGSGFTALIPEAQRSVADDGCVTYRVLKNAEGDHQTPFPLPDLPTRLEDGCIFGDSSDGKLMLIVLTSGQALYAIPDAIDLEEPLFGIVPILSDESAYSKVGRAIDRTTAGEAELFILLETAPTAYDFADMTNTVWNSLPIEEMGTGMFSGLLPYRNMIFLGDGYTQQELQAIVNSLDGRWLTDGKRVEGLYRRGWTGPIGAFAEAGGSD
ncbi:MAG: hypothetical protein WA948_03870, partial [Pontixanthobacter sp.]